MTRLMAVVLIAAAASCDAGAPGGTPVLGRGGNGQGPGSIPAMHLGPQGDVAQFVVKCGFSHSLTDDPIVHPGQPGASHLHDFFGNRRTNAASTAQSLLGGATTCNHQLDTASYWAPSLTDHGSPVTPLGSVAYYRPAPGVEPSSLQPYPSGLMMVAGDPKATAAQPVEVVAWSCGTSSDLMTTPTLCPQSAPLRVRITFPDCWDGHNVDSTDHRSHMTRSVGGSCPSSHPVAVAQLTLFVRYPISGEGHQLALSSGGLITAHADFLNAWDQRELTSEVELCLHRRVVCDVASNRAEAEPQPT